jgi:hypothetical protein
MAAFLGDLYGQPTQISTILRKHGLSASEIECLREQRCLNDLVMRFCPRLWQWLGVTVGTRGRAAIIARYGLYGARGRRVDSIAHKLGATAEEVMSLQDKALRQMRVQQKHIGLEESIVSTAHSVLAVHLKDPARQGERQPLTLAFAQDGLAGMAIEVLADRRGVPAFQATSRSLDTGHSRRRLPEKHCCGTPARLPATLRTGPSTAILQ